ncbi:TnsA endonuclease N-terminal domain-containing protein [Bacillus mycoides]|uniref:TnsA endonuclease N-terminal domain-containing protein n=1 Tax=Bacillus mycoides TaxID=1405 RepID=UPI003D03FF00
MYTPIKMKRATKYGNNYWSGLSFKMNRKVEFFSDLEYEHWLLVECDPTVKKFCEQPLKVEYILNNKIRHSIPDMWILYTDNSEKMIEVKYTSSLIPSHPKYEETMQQITIQQEWCKSNGLKHEVKTEKSIRENRILLDNYRKMVPFIRHHSDFLNSTNKLVFNELSKYSKLKLQDILNTFLHVNPNQIYISVIYLIYIGVIYSDLHINPLNKNTEVWIYDQKKIKQL